MLNKRTWVAIIILGFLGQLAWGVENQFFNTFIYTIDPNPQPVAIMVAASAVVATLASIFMGAFSDRVRWRWGRKPFLLIGYIGWGITTALFPTSASIASTSISIAIFMAIFIDCVMTFFGSTANDSVFHAYVADITTVENRGKVMGVLEILTWVALLFVYGGAPIIIAKTGYSVFFYIIGGMVLVLGLVANILVKEPALPKEPLKGSYWSQIADTFRWSTLKKQRDFFLLLISITLWGVAQQIFFPYLMIYVQNSPLIPNDKSILVIFFAILFGGIASAYPLGLLIDKWGRKKVALLAIVGEMIGLIAFSLARDVISLILTGILWLAPISAWAIVTGAWSKDLFPEDKRGQFGGYVILFSVAFTMIIGPFVGSWLINTYGVHSIIDGKDAIIPIPLIFQVGGVATLLAAIPLLQIGNKKPSISKTPQEQ